MKNRFTGIAGKIVGALILVRMFMIPITSSMAIGFILQLVLFIPMGIYAVLFNKFSKKFHIFVGICLLVPVIFVSVLAIYGNRSTTTFDEDVIIVLGAGTNVANPASPLARRMDTVVYYFERNPNAYVVVCGGLGARAAITEAEAMARHLHERGIPLERILPENLSTSTLENLTFAQEILNEHFPEGFSAVVVSNNFHMFRTVSTARRIGMDVNHLGASTPFHLLTENYLREMLAVINFWISSI